jgi:hypothetical protein
MARDLRSIRGWRLAALASLIAVATTSPVAAGVDDQARATFVLLLGKYVTWPASAFSSPTAPVVVAVLGNPALAAEARRLAVDQQLAGRPIEVREIADPGAAADAHIVFTSDAAQSSALAGAKPLRVIEGKGTLRRADVQIQMIGGRVAFAVNRKDAAQRGLKLSSKLLRLASSLE